MANGQTQKEKIHLAATMEAHEEAYQSVVCASKGQLLPPIAGAPLWVAGSFSYRIWRAAWLQLHAYRLGARPRDHSNACGLVNKH